LRLKKHQKKKKHTKKKKKYYKKEQMGGGEEGGGRGGPPPPPPPPKKKKGKKKKSQKEDKPAEQAKQNRQGLDLPLNVTINHKHNRTKEHHESTNICQSRSHSPTQPLPRNNNDHTDT